MIITRTPFRISFAGGGSDLPAFYKRASGAVLSTTINKYMYLSIHPYFDPDSIHVKYSETELVREASDLQHPILRALVGEMQITGVEITSSGDVPSGTGMGSSSAFSVGLYHCLSAYSGKFRSKEELAQKACEIEIDKLLNPIGKQDQYAAAYGGLNFMQFFPTGEVQVEPVIVPRKLLRKIDDNLLLFYTGDVRSAGEILEEQTKNLEQSDDRFNSLSTMVSQAFELKSALESGDIDDFGALLNEGWKLKKSLATAISNPRIDHYYELAITQGGAYGGKLLGAGSGGYLLFYCIPEHQEKLRQTLSELQELPFSITRTGSEVIHYDV